MRIITDPDEAREAFRPWREANARPAWRPVTEPGEGDVTASRFGGRPALRPGEAWPACGRCGSPQTLFLQLDLDALPPKAGDFGGGLLQFFYCIVCDDTGGPADADPWASFSRSHLFRQLSRREPLLVADPNDVKTLVARQIAGWTHVEDYPGHGDCERLGLRKQQVHPGVSWTERTIWADGGLTYEPFSAEDDPAEVLRNAMKRQGPFDDEIFGEVEVGDKLGGWPSWVQPPEWIECPLCGRRMRLLMQIGSEHNVDWMFGDMGTGFLMQCSKHPDVLSFSWQCS